MPGGPEFGLLDLFTHQVILPGIADLPTLKAVSALAGEVDVTYTSVTRGGWFSGVQPTTTWSAQRRPVLAPSAVAKGEPASALLISGTHLARVSLPWPVQ